jgi:hypothetical protein
MSYLEATAGETLLLDLGPLTRKNDAGDTVPVDLALGGTKLWLTIKRSKADADVDAEISKTFGVAGGPGGIAVDTPATVDNNMARATVDAVETADILETTHFAYDWQLEEPGGRVSSPDHGTLSLLAAVTRA